MEGISRKVLAKDKSNSVEMIISGSESSALIYEKDKLLYPHDSASTSIVIRVTKPDGRMGVASSSNVHDWSNVLKQASKLARVSQKDPRFKGIPVKDEESAVKLYDKRLDDLGVEGLKEHADVMLNIVSKRKMGVQEVSAGKTFTRTVFANSNGVFKSEINCFVGGGLSVVKNGIVGFSSQVFKRTPDFGKVAREAVEQCAMSQKTGKVKTGKMPFIIDYNAFSALFSSTFLSAIDGYSVHKKKSFYAGKLGEKVASTRLTVHDDATLDYALSSYSSDAEGTKSRTNTILNKGVLESFIYDHYTAKLIRRKSTGNCASIFSRPSIHPSNVVITPGKKRKEDIIARTKRGIYLTDLSGAHMINHVSGDFSNDMLKAYYVENGEIRFAVKKGMVSGNAYEMLSQISQVGRDVTQRATLISPVIKFKSLQVIA